MRRNGFESASFPRHADNPRYFDKTVRRGVLCSTVVAILLITPIPASAIQTLGEPSYTVDDWFEYDGYTESIVDQMTEQWQSLEYFNSTQITHIENLRVTQLGGEYCTIITWSGDCTKARITHMVNFTLNFETNSTNYDNDTMNMSVSYSATHWKSRGSLGWEKLDTTVLTITQFSGGGEDNYLEDETNEIILVERIGDFPSSITIGDVWDVEERSETSGELRQRENRGIWSTQEYNRSETDQMVFHASSEATVHYGVANSKSHNTIILERTNLGENITHKDFFVSDGYLAHTEIWDNGTLILSATLTDYRYYVNEPHSSSESANSLAPILIACFSVIIILGLGATWFGLSSVPKTRAEIPLIPVGTQN